MNLFEKSMLSGFVNLFPAFFILLNKKLNVNVE